MERRYVHILYVIFLLFALSHSWPKQLNIHFIVHWMCSDCSECIGEAFDSRQRWLVVRLPSYVCFIATPVDKTERHEIIAISIFLKKMSFIFSFKKIHMNWLEIYGGISVPSINNPWQLKQSIALVYLSHGEKMEPAH